MPDIRTFVISGGVASNELIRERLQIVAQSSGLDFVCPPARLCTDNGVMVAWAGLERCVTYSHFCLRLVFGYL